MSLAEDRLERPTVALRFLDRSLGRVHDPLRLAEEGRGIDRPGDGVEHAAVRGAEITGHVAALLLPADDLECRDFLERRHEVLVEELADFWVRKGVDTQRLGIVSGEERVFEMPADVE